jgi:hypothetical protein
MKRLYVGCRVRIVHGEPISEAFRKYVGCEGRIFAAGVIGATGGGVLDWGVEVSGGCQLAANSSVLEPIQDPGHQVGTWEGCVWKPEWVRAWSA